MPSPRHLQSLNDAIYLSLDFCPISGEAIEFGRLLAEQTAMLGGRTNQRLKAESQAKFGHAVGAITGELLTNHQRGAGLKAHQLSYRPQEKGTFTGGRVSYRSFRAALSSLKAAGYVKTNSSFSQFVGEKGDPGGLVQRRAMRLWPTLKLRDGCVAAGIPLEELGRHFRKMSPLPSRWPLEFRDFSTSVSGNKVKGARIALPDTAAVSLLRKQVEDFNAFVAKRTIEVSPSLGPVILQRYFTRHHDLHGRWYATGDNYQGLSAAARLTNIAIDGESVVEIDVSASHLTCFYGISQASIDATVDPYLIPGFLRPVVKAWINAAFGRGSVRKGVRWPREISKTLLEKERIRLQDHPFGKVGEAVLLRHPVLESLDQYSATLCRRFEVEAPQLLSLFLMGKEAKALTMAMLDLKRQDILALPVHDSLIVAEGALETTRCAMKMAFSEVVGIVPRLRHHSRQSHSGGIGQRAEDPPRR